MLHLITVKAPCVLRQNVAQFNFSQTFYCMRNKNKVALLPGKGLTKQRHVPVDDIDIQTSLFFC